MEDKRSGSLFQRLGILLLILAAGMFLMVGCGSSDDDDEESVVCGDGDGGLCTLSAQADPVEEGVGVFLDGPVRGLEYVSGESSGITDEHGTFSYAEGQTVTFKIGDIVLGEGTAKSEMTPIDLVEEGSVDHPEVVNMIRFLQTLDSDRDPSNGIFITDEVQVNAVGKTFDFASADDADLQAIVAELDPAEPELISVLDAKEHFRYTLVTVPGSEIYEQMNAFFEGMVQQTQSPGAVMVFEQYDGRRWVGASGIADKYTERSITACDKFRIASITKAFTAVGTLKLVHEGKLGLDDTLESLLPGAVPAEFQPEKITVAMMLNHSSGLNSFTHDSDYVDSIVYRNTRRYTVQELLDISNAMEPEAEPGQGWIYSNTNYVLLGLIIEKLTGMRWEDYTRENVLETAGLNNTVIPESGDICIPGAYSKGYMDFTDTFKGTDGVLSDHTAMEPSVAWASGAMVSSPWDLAKWIKYVVEEMEDGKIYKDYLEPDDYDASMGAPGMNWGMGFMKDDTTGIVGHVGQAIGYDSFVAYRLKNRMAMAVSTNRTLDARQFKNSRVFLYGALELLQGCVTECPSTLPVETETSAEARTNCPLMNEY